MDEQINIIEKTVQQLHDYNIHLYNTNRYDEKIDEISRILDTAITVLSSANKSLYAKRGRASAKKSISSRENGKKGGRPPKQLVILRNKKAELEKDVEQILILHEMADDNSVEKWNIDEQNKFNELHDVNKKIALLEKEIAERRNAFHN